MSVLRAVCFVVVAGMGTSAAQAGALSPDPAGVRPDRTVNVDGFGVERVESLAPGVPLRFSLYGTAGARVVVAVDGGVDALSLRETRPGMYEGEYVIGPQDRIDARSRVTATVERDGVVARAPLAEPLILERGTVPWAAVLGTRPETTAQAAPRPVGPVSPSAPPVAWPAAALPPVVASLPPVVASLPSAVAATPAPSAAACTDCATVESIVPLPPMPHDVLGGLAGAVVGAAAANAGSEGHARRALRVVGAITGYIVGGELARRLTRPSGYHVVLRLPDGDTLRRRYDAEPAFRVGDTVSVSATATSSRPGSL